MSKRGRVKVNLYIDEPLHEQVARLAEQRGETQAETMRVMLTFAQRYMLPTWGEGEQPFRSYSEYVKRVTERANGGTT